MPVRMDENTDFKKLVIKDEDLVVYFESKLVNYDRYKALASIAKAAEAAGREITCFQFLEPKANEDLKFIVCVLLAPVSKRKISERERSGITIR